VLPEAILYARRSPAAGTAVTSLLFPDRNTSPFLRAGEQSLIQAKAYVKAPSHSLLRLREVFQIKSKTTPYRLVLLVLFNPLAIRYVLIVLCVARDEDRLIYLCQTLEMKIRVRVIRLPRSPGPQLLSQSKFTLAERSPSASCRSCSVGSIGILRTRTCCRLTCRDGCVSLEPPRTSTAYTRSCKGVIRYLWRNASWFCIPRERSTTVRTL
jgi:hypothetical protein